jgi:hypothetical protein
MAMGMEGGIRLPPSGNLGSTPEWWWETLMV